MKPIVTEVRDSRGNVHKIERRPGRPINTSSFDGASSVPGLPRLFLSDGREIRSIDGRFRTDSGEWFDAV